MKNYNHNHVPCVFELTDAQRFRLSAVIGGKSPFGFYRYYFNDLKNHRTQNECFNHVNDLYFDIFGEYRYESYKSFSNQYSKNFVNATK